jgi:two-component system CheB/CheR fusion protein
VWVAGCATGEEAYSIAMLLLEQADTTESEPDIQIFASDPDDDALAFGREGLYPAAIAADVSEARLQRFFVREGTYYRVRKELREMILFAAHSMLKDPPFSQLDLISCRNLLIYFQRELQDKVYQLFHYALKPQGYLFLGSAESIEGTNSLFQEVDKAHRIYRWASPAHGTVRLPDLPLRTEVLGRMPRSGPQVISLQQEASSAEQHRQALEVHAPPSLMADADATIVHISETANRYLQFAPGTPSLNLIRTILPELRLEMRTALFRAMERNEPTTTAPLATDIQGQRRLVQLFVSPTPSRQVLVVFLDTPAPEPGAPRAEASDEDDPHLHQLEEELETTKRQLQSVLESSETQQEELRAANEELQSINEEYKSTLEELETSKEELQSINEELKTVNQELKDKVDDLSQANNNLQNLMASTDVATLFVDRQLMIRLYTPSLTRIFNIMPVDQGRPLEHVTHRLDYEHLLRDIQQVLDTLIPVEREVSQDDERYYLIRLTPYCTTDNHIDGVVITFVEITPLKRVEQQVRKSETQLRALIEVSAQIVWTTDAAGLVVADSLSWRAFTGQTYHEWMGRGWLDAVHPEDRDHAEATWRQAVETVVPLDTEFRLRHVSGGWRWTAVRAVPLRTPEGRVYGWVGMNTDITARKQAEEALRTLTATLEQRVAERTRELEQAHDTLRDEMAERQRMQEVLFQREKLAALGLLLANVAHELNNPLSVATMEIDNLAETWPADLETDDLNTLRQAIERCSSVVQSFLALARQQSTTRSPVALNALIDDVLILLRHALEADGIALELHLAEDLPPLQADANQLHHVLSNLITNAHYALRQVEPPRHLRLTTAVNTAGTQVTLEVTDNGPGIPAEIQRRIFEPFFTTRTQEGGSGLGLSLCRSIIESHGGTIRLSSQVGHGTTVHITLPVTPSADMQAPETPAATEAPAPTRRGRILLIDDEPGVQHALQRLLQRSGHEITMAANGHEGLAALEASAYDVILCDIRMPDLDGPGFYREVERRYPHLVSRVIFLTGDVLSPEAQDFFVQVACPHLVKPFQAQEVRRLIQQVLEAQ